MADTRFLVGAAGWDHPEWRDVFYPEGLPEEWRLAYYAHYYSAVLVPHSAWTSASPETLANWLRDTPQHFRFLLAVSPAEPSDGALAAGKLLGDKFAGRVGGGLPAPSAGGELRLLWLSQMANLRELARRVEEARQFPGPVYLIEDGNDLNRLQDAATLLEVMGLSPAKVLV